VKKKIQIKLFLVLIILTCIKLTAQNVVQVWPGQNRLNVPADTVISIQFDTDINPSTLNNNTIVVHASQTGLHQSGNITYNSGTRTVTFDPDDDFFIGERVSVILTPYIQNIVGVPINMYQFVFTIKALEGSGKFYSKKNYSSVGHSFSVSSADLDNDDDMDLVLSGSGAISVLFNFGNGTFDIPIGYTVGYDPRCVIAVDLDNDNDIDIAVANSQSNTVSILKNWGNGWFANKTDYAVGNMPFNLYAADFNCDGYNDLAVACYDNSNNLNVLINNGDGTFQPKVDYTAVYEPSSVYSSDLDSDGDMDIIVTSGYITIFKNNGDGTFLYDNDYTAGALPWSVYANDFDSDTDVDLATSNYHSDDVSILKNNGTGNFSIIDQYPAGFHPRGINAGDVDADTDLDLIATNQYDTTISVLINAGDATFATKTDYAVGNEPFSVFAVDIDSDGDLDLITSNLNQPGLTVLFNSESQADIKISAYNLDFGVVKIDSTNNLNLTISNIGADSTLNINNIVSTNSSFYTIPNQTIILPGDSLTIDVHFAPDSIGWYQDTLKIMSNDPDTPITQIYVSGKGDPIVSQIPEQNELNVAKNSNISISFHKSLNESSINDSSFVVSGLRTGIIQGNYSYNNMTKTILFDPDNNFSIGEVISVVLTSDIEYDNGISIDTYNYSFTVTSDSGSATFNGKRNYTVGTYPWSIVSADLDLDNDFDVVTVNRGSGDISVCFNQGNGIFQSRTDYAIGTSPWSVVSSDFNSDGAMDLAVTEESSGNVSILLNNGDGLFPTKTDYTIGPTAYYLCSADFDTDGDFDLAITKGNYNNTIAIMLNDGNGVFPQINHFPAIIQAWTITSLDLELDGDMDLATTNFASQDISIFLNDGVGNFGERNDYRTNSSSNSIISTDFNADGFNDLAWTNDSFQAISIFLNNQNGSFLPKIDYSTDIPRCLYSADYDADGDMDLAVTNHTINNVSILPNNGDGTFGAKQNFSVSGIEPMSIFSSDFDLDGDMDLVTANLVSSNITVLKNGNTGGELFFGNNYYDFGYVQIDSTEEYTLTIKNIGTSQPLEIFDIVSSNPAYNVNQNSAVINAGDSINITVSFTPSRGILYDDSLRIISNDPIYPETKFYVTGYSNPVSSVIPICNSNDIPHDTNIEIVFNADIDPSSVNDSTISIYGHQSGLHINNIFTYNNIKRTITINPDRDFFYGERVDVIVNKNVRTINGKKLLDYSWNFTVLSYGGTGIFHGNTYLPTGYNSLDLTSADFNNDNLIDIAVVDGNSDSASIMFNLGEDTFLPRISYYFGENLRSITSGDFNRDGNIDIAIARVYPHFMSVSLNNGNGEFNTKIDYSVDEYTSEIYSTDLNNDCYLDIIVATYGYTNISIFFNLGDGNFAPGFYINVGSSPNYIHSADFDKNGRQDLVVGNVSSGDISVLLNYNDDGFDSINNYFLGHDIYPVISKDFNNDGYSDIAAGWAESFSILYNNQYGYFWSQDDYQISDHVECLSSADYDCDGDNDIVISVLNSDSLLYFINDGSGLFEIRKEYNPASLINSADYNLDGNIDLAILTGNNIKLLYNEHDFSVRLSFDSQFEFSDTVKFDYYISNPDSLPTSLLCQFALDTNFSWQVPTLVNSDTSGILPENYNGQIYWNSKADLPGEDLESVYFKIIPYTQQGKGRIDSTKAFHLDNNMPPAVSIDSLIGIQSGDINITYNLSDPELDTLQITCEYFDPLTYFWRDASISGQTIDLISYTGQIVWNTNNDLPGVTGYYLIRIIPWDKDPGSADTVEIKLDQIGGSASISILNSVIGEYRGDILFNYQISDNENDLIDLKCEYSVDSGFRWYQATVTGNTSGINQINYEDSLIWHSNIDLAELDKQTIRFKITPYDNHYGFPDETNDFHVDNNQSPILSVGNIVSPIVGTVEVPIVIEDNEQDIINILASYKFNNGNWQNMNVDIQNISPNSYNDTLFWNTSDYIGFGEFQSVQIQLIPMDNDTGTGDISNQFDIYNYAGDYSGDIKINYDDLVQFAMAWGNQDLSKEIGPATGTPPSLIPQPDGIIDFEDLMVLVQQWNWSYDNPGMLEKVFTEKNKYNITFNTPLAININTNKNETEWRRPLSKEYSRKRINDKNKHLINIEQSEYDPWSNEFADNINISIDTTCKILGMYLEIYYDPTILTITDINNQLLKDQNGFTFKATDGQAGKLIINSIILGKLNNILEQEGQLINLNLITNNSKKTNIDCIWQIHDIDGKVISSGLNSFDMTIYKPIPRSYALYQNFPNPFNPSTTIRYQLPVDGKVKLEIYNILGEKVITLVNEEQTAGYYSKIWDINRIQTYASGLYIIHISVKGINNSKFSKNIKSLLIK